MTVSLTNLKWYYTSGATSQSSNTNPDNSTGGDRGGLIPDDTLNNLFPQVSGEQARDGITNTEYIGTMFINEDSDTFGTPKLWADGADADSSNVVLQYAFDSATPATNMDLSRINNKNTAPTSIRGSFAALPATSGGAVQLPGLTSNNMATNIRVGVWFSRKINAGASAADPFQYTIKVVGEANI